jgi:ABC-type transport system involved in Fe-S cluster assembly fused permease/ATPase subunit
MYAVRAFLSLQVNQYDHYLRGYQAAAIQTERLSALLNAGQSVILSAGTAEPQSASPLLTVELCQVYMLGCQLVQACIANNTVSVVRLC